MQDCNLKNTPANQDPLYKDEYDDPCCENWDYRSIVGMMLYLAGSTQPDIAYAVHQCSRFSHSLKRSHDIGVKDITQYLEGT